MKKIIVEKIPAPPPQPKARVVTELNGDEQIAYVTDSGTICTLHRLTKDKTGTNKERYGFCNLAYSHSSSPTFTAETWHEAVKCAGISRQLYAFETYEDLMRWISMRYWMDKKKKKREQAYSKAPQVGAQVHKQITADYLGEEMEIRDKRHLQFVNEISRDDVDWNGSGQVNHTHRSMTAIYNKVNELVVALDVAYKKNKERWFAFAYGSPPTTIANSVVTAGMKPFDQPLRTPRRVKMPYSSFLAALIIAIQTTTQREKDMNYTKDSAFLGELKSIYNKAKAGADILDLQD